MHKVAYGEKHSVRVYRHLALLFDIKSKKGWSKKGSFAIAFGVKCGEQKKGGAKKGLLQ